MADTLLIYLEIAALRLQLLAVHAEILAIGFGQWLTTNPDEAAGAASGLLGAFLLARKGKHAGWGWVAFLASNAAWLYFAWRRDHPGLALQQIGFTCTSLLGLWTWLIAPRLQWTEWRGDFDGNPTMWIMPLVRWRGRRLDLHKFVKPDMPGCYHTHPARAIRIPLWGGYVEEILHSATRLDTGSSIVSLNTGNDWRFWPVEWKTWRPGMVGLVHPELAHRIESLRNGRVSYSLWIRGRKTHKTELRGPGWARDAEAAP